MTAGMFGARDMRVVWEHAVPLGVKARVPGAFVYVMQDLRDNLTTIRVRLNLEVKHDVSHEAVVRGGDAELIGTVAKITGELERIGAEAFAPMLAEREARLVQERDDAVERVIALETRLATIAFAATSDEADLDRLREGHPFLARAIEEGQP